ncbi:MAG: hypothetical protein MI746_07940, partial [Pseudomonadales bacterium]|nr:hypothetical protein [Pseudomonadales bacterium]
MGALQFLHRATKVTASFTAALAFTSAVHAQQLGIQNNEVTISISGTSFSTSATLDGSGNVTAVNNVPTDGSGNLTVPRFTFTLQQNSMENLNTTFTAAIIIDEDSSDRRLEVVIPGIDMNFDASGNLTGT